MMFYEVSLKVYLYILYLCVLFDDYTCIYSFRRYSCINVWDSKALLLTMIRGNSWSCVNHRRTTSRENTDIIWNALKTHTLGAWLLLLVPPKESCRSCDHSRPRLPLCILIIVATAIDGLVRLTKRQHQHLHHLFIWSLFFQKPT